MNPISQGRIELASKINALMMIRFMVLTILFGMAFLISIKRFEITPYYFIGGIYLFTGISAFLVKRIKNLFIFALVQICFDVVFETGILYFTNGIYSPLIFLYIFSIIATSIILYTRSSFIIATFSSLSLGLISLLNYYNRIPRAHF